MKMTKKVFDIFPPSKKEVLTSRKKRTLPKFQKKFVIPFFFFVFFVSLFLFSGAFSKVKIEVWPKKEEKEFEGSFFVSTFLSVPSFSEKEVWLPGQIFETQKEIEDRFLATGKILKKATGKIRVFNAYSTRDEVWKEKTRFVSSEGKIFLSKDKIFVPGAKIKNGKLEPSFVDVEVEAQEGGKEYNIGPSKFSILAFKGTEKYFKFWGESFEPMSGGGEATVVKKEDLEGALSLLLERIEKEKGKEILEKEISKDFLFPENLISAQILQKNFSAKEGDETPEFKLKTVVKIKTLLIEKEKIKEFFEKIFYSMIDQNKEIVEQREIKVFAKTFDFESGKFLISAKSQAKVSFKVDQTLLKKEIAGLNLKETKERLLSKQEIERAKIKVFPFWVLKIPENLEKIEIEIH